MSDKHSVAAIVVKNGRVLIGKRIDVGQMGGRWEFPGGKVDPGETYEEALKREFREEFSQDIIVIQPITEAQFQHNDKTVHLHAFHVELCSRNPLWVLTEHTEVEWVSFEEIKNRNFVDSDLLIYEKVKSYFENL
ncbi:MAG: (deoxy)nucleoside triphosphate pyrophosphohydrolase [Spirochaetaceae bacterium]|nr:(deoxy)nucleoside triphosphate pyrophosphohydrolase [Spirochaetaceae bacterium]